MMDYTGENGGLLDDRPMRSLPPLEQIGVSYFEHKPSEWDLKGERTMFIAAGYYGVGYVVTYQETGMPYRVEWWGSK